MLREREREKLIYIYIICCWFNLRSVSGSVLARLLDVEVNVVALGGRGGKPSPRIAAVCATHAPGSIGRTGSVRGIVK